MLQTAHCVGGSVYPCFPKNDKIYGIHLVPTTEPNEIHGKVQICSPHEIEHYGKKYLSLCRTIILSYSN